ncbi:MAG: hypothetical protein NVS1B3_12490 [Candidatus Dormibacteraceae bacterium]
MFRGPFLTRLLLAGVAAAITLTAACGGTTTPPGTADVGSGSITGAGATFPQPFYQKAFYNYSAKHSQVQINYQPVGSGAGIQQFIKQLVDFGASDVPMEGADRLIVDLDLRMLGRVVVKSLLVEGLRESRAGPGDRAGAYVGGARRCGGPTARGGQGDGGRHSGEQQPS